MPTTDQTKPFKSYDEQIALLRERGLIITDDVYARDVLKRMNYYRFSAYSLTLRENDRFFPEVTLQDMVALYDFDQEFRSIIFKYGAVVETVARAYIAYYHARQHGPIGYLNNQNFESEQYHAVFLSTLNREISRSDEPFIVHHKRDKRGVYPLWVAVEDKFCIFVRMPFGCDVWKKSFEVIITSEHFSMGTVRATITSSNMKIYALFVRVPFATNPPDFF